MSSDLNPYESPLPARERDDEPERYSDAADQYAPPFVSVTPWAVATILAFALVFVQASADMVIHVRQYAYYRSFTDASQIDPAVEADLFQWESLLNITNLLVRLILIVPLLVWMYYAHRNLEALGHRKLDAKHVWAVLCWFVPVLNLFAPYLVLRELWWRSDPAAKDDPESAAAPHPVFAWWLMWLGAMATAFALRFLPNATSLAEAVGSLKVRLLYAAFEMAAVPLAMYVIFKVDRNQFQRIRLIQG
jgi:hypothetical protein